MIPLADNAAHTVTFGKPKGFLVTPVFTIDSVIMVIQQKMCLVREIDDTF